MPGLRRRFIRQAAGLVGDLPRLLAGKEASLVLFSSYRQMNEVAVGLRAKGLSLLVQGEASRNALLTLHKQKCDGGQASILFGTGSFSEGLDLPGHYLTNLVITKLPFAVPNSPVEEATADEVRAEALGDVAKLWTTGARTLVHISSTGCRQAEARLPAGLCFRQVPAAVGEKRVLYRLGLC